MFTTHLNFFPLAIISDHEQYEYADTDLKQIWFGLSEASCLVTCRLLDHINVNDLQFWGASNLHSAHAYSAHLHCRIWTVCENPWVPAWEKTRV